MAKTGTASSASRAKAPKSPAKKPRAKPAKKITSREKGKRATNVRGRKKQLHKWRRYAAVMVPLTFVITFGIAYEQDAHIEAQEWLHDVWLESTASAGFRFRELVVEGRNLTQPDDVIQAVGLAVGDSLFMVSLDEIRLRLLALDTVRDAHVTRDLKGRITVTLYERKPFALWQHRNRLWVIDPEGKVLRREKPQTYPYLLTIVGEEAPAYIDMLVELLRSNPPLADKVVAAVFVSNRRWDIHFDNGVRLLLPEHQAHQAWNKLASMQQEHQILARQVEAIDMRLDDRMFITLPEELDNTGAMPANDV